MKVFLVVEFPGRPGDTLDTLAHAIVHNHGGHVCASGTFIGGGNPLRDLEAEVPQKQADACMAELKAKGFDVKRGG